MNRFIASATPARLMSSIRAANAVLLQFASGASATVEAKSDFMTRDGAGGLWGTDVLEGARQI
jgi:hypothetical protein